MTAVETAPVPVYELLARFVLPAHPLLKSPIIVHNYRGDYTETGDRRLRAMLGAAYESLHFDTVACDGRAVVYLPRFRAPGAVEIESGHRPTFGLTGPHHWAMSQVDERSPEVTRARPATVQRVPVEIARDLHALPELEFVDVRDVHFTEYGNRPRKKKKPAPQDVVYFRFAGGYGVVLPRALGGAAS